MPNKEVFGKEVRGKMLPYLHSRRYRVLRRLTTEFKGGTLIPHNAMGFAGELAAIQETIDDLEGEQKEENRQMTTIKVRR